MMTTIYNVEFPSKILASWYQFNVADFRCTLLQKPSEVWSKFDYKFISNNEIFFL